MFISFITFSLIFIFHLLVSWEHGQTDGTTDIASGIPTNKQDFPKNFRNIENDGDRINKMTNILFF